MAGISSLYTASSGIKVAQAGLYVTGHNVSNVDTVGYSRQRTLQSDAAYQTVGYESGRAMRVGLGADIGKINQIRDKFLDITYRQEATRLNFYAVKYNAGVNAEEILGELQNSYKAQSVMQDLWDALNELHMNPTGVDTRGTFISTAKTFINKINDVYKGLTDEQYNLNREITGAVSEVNHHIEAIKKLNFEIASAEVSGDRANDYRDARNNHIDELSKIIDITYVEDPRTGMYDIYCDGNGLLVEQYASKIGLRYTAADCLFVEPVFTSSEAILPYEPYSDEYKSTKALFNVTVPISPTLGNDGGSLKAMLLARGTEPINYSSLPKQEPIPPEPLPSSPTVAEREAYEMAMEIYRVENDEYQKALFNATRATIPKLQREFDTMVNAIVKMVNDTFAPAVQNADGEYVKDPNAPYGQDGSQHTEIFVRKFMDRYDEDGKLIPEDESDYYSLYTIGNIIVNPIFNSPSEYGKIALSTEGDISDNSLVLDMLQKWKSEAVSFDGSSKMSVEDFYKQMIIKLGIETNSAKSYVEAYSSTTEQADMQRMRLSGVSLDEEMSNMIKYQHAYSASARIFNVIDSMLDKLINSTGRAGL